MINELKIMISLEGETGDGSQKRKLSLIRDSLSERMEYIYDVCFNPFVTTKLSHLEFHDNPSGPVVSGDSIWDDFVKLVEDLKKAPAANDLLRERAISIASNRMDESEEMDTILRKTLVKILTKKMNVGVGAKLINRAVGKELIPDPSLMLATDDQKSISNWEKIYCEEKYDGVRVIAIGNSEKLQFYTRAFNELDRNKLSSIEKSLKILLSSVEITGDIFFDGELTDLNRKSVSGKVTQILKGTASDNIDEGFVFNVFDFENASVLKTGKGTDQFILRRKNLENMFSQSQVGPSVTLAKQWIADSMDDVNSIYGLIISNGGEGVILKPGDHVYECKRSKNWVKLKQIQDCDLEITGWYPGEGKREGFIGGFICTDLSRTVSVKVGSGFTDSDLQLLSKNPDSLIGKIAAIQYNEPITDKFGARSLFLPRFIEVRSDKAFPDDLSSSF